MEVKSTNRPYISVVTAAFNEEKYLRRCLTSLQDQTYPKDLFDVTVVDNNSTDNTSSIARKFGASVILEKKQGYVFALKRGMSEAKGDIVAVTDSDSKVADDWLATIEKIFSDPKVVAATGAAHVDSKSRIVRISMNMLYIFFMYLSAIIGKPNLSGFNFAVRRDALAKVGGFDTRYAMSPDVDLGIRLTKVGKVKVVNGLSVITSFRRWESGFFSTLWDYTKGYFYASWLRKPPPVKQVVVR